MPLGGLSAITTRGRHARVFKRAANATARYDGDAVVDASRAVSVASMSQDHYVAQTYLSAFIHPQTGRLHAYSKRDSRYFVPSTGSVCKTMNWDQTPKFLSPPDALGRWLKIFEPPWASVVAKLEASHDLAPDDKYVIAGYWAYLSTCTPTWRRVAVALQQHDLDTIYVDRFTAHAQTHPDEFPKAADYLPLLREGKLTPEIDKNFPKALVITQLLRHQSCLYHEAWEVIWNDTDELFLTSDNPSCLDYQYGNPIRAARYLPVTPRLAVWTIIGGDKLPEIRGGHFSCKAFNRTASDTKVRA
jgi:Protein of unknown function (DUF4238)